MPTNVPDPHVDQWVDITDFTPGIYNNTYISGVDNVIVPAPMGSANVQTTYDCMALPNGGLGPLPRQDRLSNYTKATATLFTPLYLVGIINVPTSDGTQILTMVEGQNTTHHIFIVRSYLYNPTTTNWTTVHLAQITQVPGRGFFGCPYPVMTRMTTTATATTRTGWGRTSPSRSACRARAPPTSTTCTSP